MSVFVVVFDTVGIPLASGSVIVTVPNASKWSMLLPTIFENVPVVTNG